MLSNFLLEQIADEELAAARLDELVDGWMEEDEQAAGDDFTHDPAVSGDSEMEAHLSRWSPRRVQLECAAKRAMVLECGALLEGAQPAAVRGLAMRQLQLLSSPYQDHPLYRPEWHPGT